MELIFYKYFINKSKCNQQICTKRLKQYERRKKREENINDSHKYLQSSIMRPKYLLKFLSFDRSKHTLSRLRADRKKEQQRNLDIERKL